MIMQGVINLGPESTKSNLGTFIPDNFRVTVTNVGVRVIFAKDCRAPPYIVNIYREFQQLWTQTQTCHAYNFEKPNPPPNPSSYIKDIENYMTIYE